MGPQPCGRGNEALPLRVSETCDTLQWGRNPAVAEIHRAKLELLFSLRGFNGAATLRSRKFITPSINANGGIRLQWGRNPAVAEISWQFSS